MSRYGSPKFGEWVQPARRGYHLACCDCGLVHVIDFRLIKNPHGLGKKIQLRYCLNERSTGQMRRWMKKRNRAEEAGVVSPI